MLKRKREIKKFEGTPLAREILTQASPADRHNLFVRKLHLLIDFATLTAAARIALGWDIGALFTDNENLAREILRYAERENDPLCRLPLYAPYRKLIESNFADITTCAETRWGGAIIAALFLREFVDREIPWLHLDINDANEKDRPGRPKGGEVQGLRALFNYILAKYS